MISLLGRIRRIMAYQANLAYLSIRLIGPIRLIRPNKPDEPNEADKPLIIK